MKLIEGQADAPVKDELRLVSRRVARETYLGGISESTEERLPKLDPTFPKRVEISPGLTGYVLAELTAYIRRKIEQRDRGDTPAIVLHGERLGRSGKGGRPRRRKAFPFDAATD